MSAPSDEALLKAGAELLPRTGAASVEIRYSDPDTDAPDGPVVWMAIATYRGAQPQVAAALAPGQALYRLLEQLIDGGQCTHCKKPTGITADFDPMPAAEMLCWWQFDPELSLFRRGCS